MTPVCVYEIDAHDCLVRVDDGWREFARANAAPEFADDELILGRPLLSFVSDSTTKLLYDVLFRRTREQQRPIDVPFRCDSPRERRWLEMQIAPGRDGRLRMESHLVRSEPRALAPILERAAPREGALVRMCSWCKDIEAGGRWLPVERAVAALHLFGGETVPPLTHGICPPCVARLEASFDIELT